MTSPAELFTSFQDLVKDDASLHASNAETFAKLIALAEDPSVPLLLRVKVVQYIGQYVGFYDAAICKKTAQLSVKLLSASESDAVDPLLVGAVKLWVALSKVSSERKPEYFAREGTDVLIQVVLGVEGFSLAVREAAKGAIDALCRVNLKPVITKLVHLISDDRESDEPEQLAKEREFSLNMLQSLVQNRAEFAALWNDEVQQHFLTCLGLVLHTVPHSEFKRLVGVAQQLPLVKEKQLLPLLDGFLAGVKLETDRSVEGLSIILAHVPRAVASYPALAEKVLSTPAFLTRLQAASTEASVTQPSGSVAQLDVLVAASRWATTESAEALLAVVVSSLLPRVFDPAQGVCDNLVLAEGTVLALCYLATKCAQKVLQILSEPAFQESIGKVVQLLEELQKEYRFTAKKKVETGEAKEEDARALTVLANLLYLLKPLGQRHLPSLATFVPSWQKIRADILPRVKRAATRTEDDDERKAKKGTAANNNNNNSKAAKPATHNAGAKKVAAQPPSRSNAKKR